MTAAAASSSSDPKFIKYLLNPARTYQCYLVVGNPKISTPEKIGVVTDMLFAHSSVMRTDLQVSNIQKGDPIEILDIFPHTFRNLLRYVYGLDTSETLSFEDADNLLYAAEKYIITDLRDKLATRLTQLLNSENICSLMNNPACYQPLDLNARINKILRTETRQIFATPSFLDLSEDAFVKILEQSALNVKEIEVWRSAIKWAKHKANSDDGGKLRTELKKPLRHIRLGSLTPEELCREVVPTKVLLNDEIAAVCLSAATKQKQAELPEICNEIKARRRSGVKSSVLTKFWSFTPAYGVVECVLTVKTRDSNIKLLSLTVVAKFYGKNHGHTFNFTINIEQVEKPETKVTIPFSKHNPSGQVTIRVSTADREVLLKSNSEYRVTIGCNQSFSGYTDVISQPSDEHFTITYKQNQYRSLNKSVKKITYRTVE